MRTTVEFDPDTAKAIEALRRERGTGVSEAVNELVRRGMVAPPEAAPFEPIRRDLGLTIDVSNVADALDLLEGPEAR
jgi:Ribbon-helix-helix protein, copG family